MMFSACDSCERPNPELFCRECYGCEDCCDCGSQSQWVPAYPDGHFDIESELEE